jgi:dolichol-phosphate mannosyltransferase
MTSKPINSTFPVKAHISNNSSIEENIAPRPLISDPISVVIPTLNEVANITILPVQLDRILTQAGISYEAIVVDDHSTDGTVASAQALIQKENLPVRILIKQGRPGKSFSLIEGFAAAKFDVLATIDGDLQYSPESLLEMLYLLEDSDMVLADRRIGRRGHAYRPRELLSQVFPFILNILFGIDHDTQSGLKVFRRKVYKNVPTNPGRWSFELYLVVQAVQSGYLIANMPVVPNQRHTGTSKVHPVAVGMELMIEVFRLKLSLVSSASCYYRRITTTWLYIRNT